MHDILSDRKSKKEKSESGKKDGKKICEKCQLKNEKGIDCDCEQLKMPREVLTNEEMSSLLSGVEKALSANDSDVLSEANIYNMLLKSLFMEDLLTNDELNSLLAVIKNCERKD